MHKLISSDVTTGVDLEVALQRIGLRDKQAAVYLTCLKLGPSSVQNIARKAHVARATTYIILEALMARGLVSKYTIGKRPLFVAQSPEGLLSLVEAEEKVLSERKEQVRHILPALLALSHDPERNLALCYHEGVQGLKIIRQELVKRCAPIDVWRNIVPVDELSKVYGIKDISCRERIAKRIQSKTLLFTEDEKLKTHLRAKSAAHLNERRFLESSELGGITGITVCRTYVAFGLYQGRVGGLLIDSAPISSTLSQFFDLIWKHAGA